ncbi:MAG TPA: hypothetical protein VIF12_03875 [Micavibrio sp.]|jgi:hypothetical protein
MLKHIIEASSPQSYEAALNRALADAVTFTSETHDAHVSLHELSRTDDDGYRAVLEISLSPLSLDQDSFGPENPFRAVDCGSDADCKLQINEKCGRIEKLIEDYLADKTYINLAEVPHFILSHMKPEDLIDKIVVSEFQEAVEPEAASSAFDFSRVVCPDDLVPVIEEEPASMPE